VAGYIFGRSVIATAAYVMKHTAIPSTTDHFKIKLAKAATYGAVLTVFASFMVSKTTTTQALNKFLAMTVTAKTFGATDCLLISTDGVEAQAGKLHSIVVRFKDK
jgi:DNA uptake protein ComE-like DNA-binding protein